MNRLRIVQIILLILYLGMLAFFTYECFQTGASASKQAGNFANAVAKVEEAITKKPIVVDNNYRTMVSKVFGHYGYFCILGLVSILFYMTFTKLKVYMRFIIHLAVGISFAFLSEFIAEALTEGRTASIVDVGIDSLGLITLSGLFIITYYVVIVIKKKKEKKSSDELSM